MDSKRRTTLAALAFGLSGCLGGGDSTPEQTPTQSPSGTPTRTSTPTQSPSSTPTATDTPTESPTPTETPTPTPQPASFELVEYDAPDTAAIGETVEVTATVRNTGEVAGVFSADVYARLGTSEQFSPLDDPVEVEIPPGEETEVLVIEYQPYYTNEALETRLGEFSTVTVNAVSANLKFGRKFQRYDGYLITLFNPRLTQSYTTEGYTGEEQEEQASDGSQWMFVTLNVENKTGGAEYAPFDSDFAVLAGNTQFDPEFLAPEPTDQGQAYEGGELQAGVVREGYLAFEVDAGLSLDDLQVAYSTEEIEGDITVYWQSETQNSLGGWLERLL